MKKLTENLANLVKVKTIVTLMLTIVFCILALCGAISSENFMTVFTVVIAFYFGSQVEKLAAKAAGTYTGPQQSGVVVQQTPAPIVNSVDETQVQEIHPPDEE